MTDNKKNNSIEYILAQGFAPPPTFWGRIKKMHQQLGWRFIFWDMNYNIIFATITLLGVWFMFTHAPMDFQYSVTFGFSPVLFLLIVLFTEMSERACSVYELKQTCLYTPRQISALRCICYSLVGVVFTVAVTAFSAENMLQFSHLLPLCLSGLFLCALLKLTVLRFSSSRWTILAFSILWIIINTVLPFILGARWEAFLSSIPIAFTIAFAMLGAAGFIYQTNKLLTEERNYAYA